MHPRAILGIVMVLHFTETQEMSCQSQPRPVWPSRPEDSGWHVLIGEDFTVNRWYWDAAVVAWRADPAAFEAETPLAMACLGFVYLKEG